VEGRSNPAKSSGLGGAGTSWCSESSPFGAVKTTELFSFSIIDIMEVMVAGREIVDA
jgi:hypothetical protein